MEIQSYTIKYNERIQYHLLHHRMTSATINPLIHPSIHPSTSWNLINKLIIIKNISTKKFTNSSYFLMFVTLFFYFSPWCLFVIVVAWNFSFLFYYDRQHSSENTLYNNDINMYWYIFKRMLTNLYVYIFNKRIFVMFVCLRWAFSDY